MKKAFLLAALALAIGCFATAANAGTPKITKVGFTCHTLGNPFFVSMANGIEKAAKEINPAAVLTSLSADNDLAKQTQQMDDLIAAGNEVILIDAIDHDGIIPAIRRAKEAGIVVIAVNNSSANADVTIETDQVHAGKVAGEYTAKRLGGKGNVIIITDDPVSAVVGRVGGFKSVIETYPDIKILSDNQNAKGHRDLGYTVMADLLTAFPKIDAVFCINDPEALGADLAIRQAGRDKEMFTVGIDGSPEAVSALKDPKSTFAASSAQDPAKMGADGVKMAWDIMNGKTPKETYILMPTTLVSRDNVGSYAGWE